MPGKPGAYDLSAIVQWLRADGPWRPVTRQDDPLLAADGDSRALERYRAAKAATAELDLALRQGDLIDRAKLRSVLTRWAAHLRRTGELLRKHHGKDAAQILDEALDECRDLMTEVVGVGN